jgi:hypothetical protein
MPFDMQERCLQSRVAGALQSRAAAEPDFNPWETESNPHGGGAPWPGSASMSAWALAVVQEGDSALARALGRAGQDLPEVGCVLAVPQRRPADQGPDRGQAQLPPARTPRARLTGALLAL